MCRELSFAVLVVLLIQIAGCLGKQAAQPTPPLFSTESKADAVEDPAGPIPRPSLPPQLIHSLAHSLPHSDDEPDARAEAGTPIAYRVECFVQDMEKTGGRAPAGGAAKIAAQAQPSAEQAEIIDLFKKNTQLYILADKTPTSLAGLEQRLSLSLKEGQDILRSLGYYDGAVSGFLDSGAGEQGTAHTLVRVIFTPGQRYAVGQTTVRESSASARNVSSVPPSEGRTSFPPASLADAGLPKGSPARASEVLAAVNRVLKLYHESGHPFASIASARYFINREQQKLEADILVIPGEFVRMGNIEKQGASAISPDFVKAMRTWEIGQPWKASQVENFQEALRQSGLFQSVDIQPARASDAHGARAVITRLESAPERTVSASLKYHSDFGPGLQAAWEHRNFTGQGDLLRVEAPLWLDMQELAASYRLPFFSRNNRNFLAAGNLLNQNLDAYSLQAASASAGIEQRFSQLWSGSLMSRIEGGSIKEPQTSRREYLMYGLPLNVGRSSVDNLLNATRGSRLQLSLAPYAGEFGQAFMLVRSRLDGQAFFSLGKEDRLVLALRGTLGTVAGATAAHIPPSTRFYSGGGGSVRGYAYQSLGPRDSDRKPLGGNALMESSAEMRWKITPQWGLAGFVDGGAAIDQPLQYHNSDMRWGAGIGLRYYTAIGPIRFDLATPLNPRSDDAPLQCYISIGQSF